jgi:quercetin dioxygenase-like cupin family protein
MTAPTPNDATALRFGDGVARILFSRARSAAGPSVVELTMPEGAASPLHVHDEDERVFLLQGRVTFTVGGEEVEAVPHTKLVLPAGIPHTYRVESAGRARWLVVTESGRFERFVRAVSRPASEPAPLRTTLAEAVAFTVAAVENGIEILAPAAERRAPETAPAPAPERRLRTARPTRSLRVAPAAA